MLQATGHLNPSFKLAKMLRGRGHRVEYASSEKHEEAIRRQGFNTHNVYQENTPALKADHEVAQKKYSAFFQYAVRYTIGKMFAKYLRNVAMYTVERKLMMNRIKHVLSLEPDLIVVDSMAPLCRAVIYYAYNVKVVMLQTMMSPTQAPQIPPLHSRLIPNRSPFYATQVRMSWYKHYAKRYFRKYWRRLIYFNSDPYTLSTTLIKKCGLPEDQLDGRRTINSGLIGLSEISLVPRELDFPRTYQDYEAVAGHAVDVNRIERPMDERARKVVENNSRPLIYCSLGTLSTVHNARSAQLLKKIIRAVRYQPWEVLFSIGPSIKFKDLGTIPPNVHIFETLPQLEVLRYADLMITHGGMNSVVECILREVPMVVCPLNNHWDQNGNAARVVYHGLGVRSQLRWERPQTITEKINQVLCAAVFQENVLRMKSKIVQGDQHLKIADMISRILADSQRLAA